MVDDPIDAMKKLLDGMRPGAENAALLAGINQALADIVSILEKRQQDKPGALTLGGNPFAELTAAIGELAKVAAVREVAPSKPWTKLVVSAPVDSMGRPTGEMTITRTP